MFPSYVWLRCCCPPACSCVRVCAHRALCVWPDGCCLSSFGSALRGTCVFVFLYEGWVGALAGELETGARLEGVSESVVERGPSVLGRDVEAGTLRQNGLGPSGATTTRVEESRNPARGCRCNIEHGAPTQRVIHGRCVVRASGHPAAA